MTWYYARGGQRFGPVEHSELQRLAAAGQLTASDLVWRSGLPDWRPAGQTQELAPMFQPVPPAPSVPPPPQYTPPPQHTPPPAPYGTPPYGAVPQPAPGYGATPYPTGLPQYASFGARLGAFLIDQLILLVVGFVFGFVVGLAIAGSGGDVEEATVLIQLMGAVIGWLYYALQESSSQMGTVGKRALGLRVTDLSGQRIGFGRATGRHFGKILSALALLLGFILMISDPRRQTWHDKMAGCLVMRVR